MRWTSISINENQLVKTTVYVIDSELLLLLKGPWGQNATPVFMTYLTFMEKKPCIKFCCVLIRFQEVIKLQSFEFSLSDVISANI